MVLYIVGTTLLGSRCTRGQHDLRTYFVGDRNVAWWLVLISIVATETSTVTFLSVPGMGFPLAELHLLAAHFGLHRRPHLHRLFPVPAVPTRRALLRLSTVAQALQPGRATNRFGIFLLTRMMADGLRLYLAGLLFQQFTGWNIEASVLALGTTTILYTYLGGMQAVIWTDLIQFMIYIFGALFGGYILLLPGGWSEFLDAGGQAGK